MRVFGRAPVWRVTTLLLSWVFTSTTVWTAAPPVHRELTVTVGGVAAALAGGTFTATVPLAEGNNDVTAVATSAVGRTASDSVTVTRDSIPPVVVLDAPERISRGKTAQAVASASDNLALTQVVIRMDGVVLGTFTAPPYVVTLTVPEGAQNGQTLTVVAEATDQAGNTASASRGVRVAADGAVVGQALDDSTSLPLLGATVTLLGASGVSATTDERGRYSLPTGGTSRKRCVRGIVGRSVEAGGCEDPGLVRGAGGWRA